MRNLLRRADLVASRASWIAVAVTWLAAMGLSARRFYHFGPDTRYYLAMAYHYSGLSEAESGRRTYEFLNTFSWFKPFCYGACDTTKPGITYDWLFHGESGGLVAPRVLYPLLSAPFVRLFGPYGMLVIPVLSMAACTVLVVIFASRLAGRQWAGAAGVLLVLTISMSRYGLYAYTEALAMLLCTAAVMTLPIARRTGRRDLIVFGVLFVLFAFTRQFHPILVGAVGIGWLVAAVRRRSLRNEWLPFLGIGIGLSLVLAAVQSLMGPGYSPVRSFLQLSGAKTLSGVPGALPHVIRHIVGDELFVAGEDFVLVMLVILCAYAVVVLRRSPLVHAFVGLVLGTFALHVLNTEPSQNRYYATVVPTAAVLGALALKRIFADRSRAREDDRDEDAEREEAEEPTGRHRPTVAAGTGPST